ncbi:hypothetical protein B0J11DRAFT_431428 [Dendryphion nanum]|uniref:VWFA domain-containing protein n=1 Tax=Dendryphion nanum TaxID=256645 RepID=A0A9P9E0W3_9PLEO|nr:hypothetical protein B0J11DRAFT_431428 [Dendryphion nanum]
MFNNFKERFSRRGSNPFKQQGGKEANDAASKLTPTTSSSGHLAAPRNSNPFASADPVMRQPGMFRSRSFCPLSPYSTLPDTHSNPSEAPPSYSAATASSISPPTTSTSADDQYDFLKSFDTIFLIDDSGSMAGRSWRETQKALETITPICTERDADGIDIYFLNHPDSTYHRGIKRASTIIEIFQNVRPGGGTPTGQKLNKIVRPYLREYESKPDTTKPINIIVITDGEPSDDVESVIINAAKKLDRLEAPSWQVGIQFFQVGKEPSARKHLKQLDDGLQELAGDDELRDIVDTVPFTGDGNEELTAAGIMKVVLGSVNRRLDRNSRDLHR